MKTLEGHEVGQRRNRLDANSFVEQRRGCQTQLLFPGFQGRRPCRTRRAVFAQVGAGQPKEKCIDIGLQ